MGFVHLGSINLLANYLQTHKMKWVSNFKSSLQEIEIAVISTQ